MASTGTSQVDSIASLLNSTASDEEQIIHAAKIVDCKIQQTLTLDPPALALAPPSLDPKHERILRWLLFKINKQEPNLNSALIDAKTYNLLMFLLLHMQNKVALRQLQHVDFCLCISKCLRYTWNEMARLVDDSKGTIINLGMDSNDLAQEILEHNTEKMRVLLRFVSVCQVFKAVQQMISSSASRNMLLQMVRNVMKLSSDLAAGIIESGLWCIYQIVDNKEWKQFVSLEDQLMTPLLSVWDLASDRTPSNEEVLHSAKALAKHCLLPSLQLIVKRPTTILRNFIIEQCLLPLQKSLINHEKQSEVLSIIFESMPQTSQADRGIVFTKSPSVEAKSDPLSPMPQMDLNVFPLVIKLLWEINGRDKSVKKDVIRKQYKEILISLTGRLGIDVIKPSRQNLSNPQVNALVKILEAFQEIEVSPGLDILSNIILHYAHQDLQSFSQQVWRMIKTCLIIQPEVVCSNSDQSTLVINHILNSFLDANDQKEVSVIDGKLEHDALELLLEPLLDAFVSGRKVQKFVPFWRDFVVRAFEKSQSTVLQGDIKSQQTFWELISVQQAIQSCLTKGLSVTERLELFDNSAESVLQSLQSTKDISTLYSNVVMLSTIVMSLEQADSRLVHTQQASRHTSILELYLSAAEYYMESSDFRWKYLLLELLDGLRSLVIIETMPAEMIMLHNKFIPAIGSQILKLLDQGGDRNEYRCASQAWISLLLMLGDRWNYNEILSGTVLKILLKLDAFLDKLKTQGMTQGFQTTLEKLDTTGSEDLGSAADFTSNSLGATIYCPNVYDIIQPINIRKLTNNIYACAFLSTRGKGTQSNGHTFREQTTDPWLSLWHRLVQSDIVTDNVGLYEAIQQTQTSSFVDEGSTLLSLSKDDLETQLAFYEFVLRDLSGSTSATSFLREDLGRVVDHLMMRISSETITNQTLSMSLALLCRLTKDPTKVMALVTDPQIIWSMSRTLSNQLSLENINHLRALTRNLILYWILHTTGKEPKISIFATALEAQIQQLDYKTMSTGVAIVVATAISIFHKSEHHFGLVGKELQLQYLESRIQFLMHLRPFTSPISNGTGIEIYANLDNIYTLPLSTCKTFEWYRGTSEFEHSGTSSSIDDFLRSLEQNLRPRAKVLTPNDSSLNEILTWTKAKDVMMKMEQSTEDISQVMGEELPFLPGPEMNQRLHELQSIFENLSLQSKVRLLDQLSDKATELNDDQLNYLRRLVAVRFVKEHQQDSLKVALRKVFDTSLRMLEEIKQPETILRTLKIICTILDQNPWVTTQNHIDQSLCAITLATCVDKKITVQPSLPDSTGAAILDQLIKILSTILQKHRSSIGNRPHLVSGSLYGILHCLFIPYPGHRIPQPDWITGDNSQFLSAQHVSALSRVLCTICDPSPEALRRKVSTMNGAKTLNDASKAARAICGQDLQNFIGDLCRLLLKGKMLHRDALKPGIYALFDAMSRDVQNAQNARLNDQERVIFRTLYEDWKKFGKWDGN